MVDTTPALTEADQSLLTQLTSYLGQGMETWLAQVTGNSEWTTANQPDFLAVRSGAGVTAQFSGGSNVTSWTNGGDNTTVTYFGGGTAPTSYKGVAIKYGADATPADRENEKRAAMAFLNDHLDDHQIAGGAWNRPLIDSTL